MAAVAKEAEARELTFNNHEVVTQVDLVLA